MTLTSTIRCDNGPEYISGALLAWAEVRGIRIEHIQPGKPQQNAYLERYNRTVRYDWLGLYLFDSVEVGAEVSHSPAMDIQSRTPEHGARRHHMQAEIDARCLTPRLATAKNGGLPKDLHADNFHATMKASLYLDDVTESSSAFAYMSGPKRLTWRRLCWEYRQRVQGRDLPDRYSRRGSLRLAGQDRRALGLPEPQRFAVPADTLLIANSFGFHACSPADQGSTRLAIYASNCANPFNPRPGLDLHWSSQLKHRALQWNRRRQDQQAARHGTQPNWHRVHQDAARGSDGTAS